MDTSPQFSHTTVLLHETVDGVLTTPDGVYVDGTFGRGGHSRLLLSKLGEGGRLIAIDRDLEAIAAATEGATRVTDPRFSIVHSAFADMRVQLAALGVEQVQGVLLDLGVSSPQIDNPERGFSFRFSGPLDMRMDTTRGESAADFLARADERQIAEVITRLWRRTVCCTDCKGACCSPRERRRPRSQHRRTCRTRGSRGQNPRSRPEPCNAHISSASDSCQRRA